MRQEVRFRAERTATRRRTPRRTSLAPPPTGDATADRCLAIVHAILGYGVEEGLVGRNVAASVKRLKPARSVAIDARSPETIELIRRQMNQRDAALVSVLAYEGIRPAEAFALRWRGVLDDQFTPRKRLIIEQNLSAGQATDTKNREPRTPKLFDPVAEDLLEHWKASGKPPRSALVFPDTGGGIIRASNWHRRSWQPALRAAGLEHFRPYDMRHTSATLLIYAGWNPLDVADHLGHGDPGFTLRTYGHVFRDATSEQRVSITRRILRGRKRGRAASSPGAVARAAGVAPLPP